MGHAFHDGMKLLESYAMCLPMNIPDFVNERGLGYAGREQANRPHPVLSAFHRQRAAERFYCRPGRHHATHKRRAYPTRVWRMHEHHSISLFDHAAGCCFCGHEMRLRIGNDRKGETCCREFRQRNTLDTFLRNTDSVEGNIDLPGLLDHFVHMSLYGLFVKRVE